MLSYPILSYPKKRLVLVIEILTNFNSVCYKFPENTSPSQRGSQSEVFLQEPPFIHYNNNNNNNNNNLY